MSYIETPQGRKHVDGFISYIRMPDGKTYGLQASVIEVKEIKCKNCGHPLKLKYGEGECEMCGSQYTTKFEIVEV